MEKVKFFDGIVSLSDLAIDFIIDFYTYVGKDELIIDSPICYNNHIYSISIIDGKLHYKTYPNDKPKYIGNMGFDNVIEIASFLNGEMVLNSLNRAGALSILTEIEVYNSPELDESSVVAYLSDNYTDNDSDYLLFFLIWNIIQYKDNKVTFASLKEFLNSI